MKMKKIVALVTASALCLGMSMTVLADQSLTDYDLQGVEVDGEYWNQLDPGDVANTSPNANYRVDGSSRFVQGALNEIVHKYAERIRKNLPGAKDLSDDEIAAAYFTQGDKDSIKDEVQAIVDVFSTSQKGNESRLDIFKDNGYKVPDGDVNTYVMATGDLKAYWKDGDQITDEEFKKKFPNGITQQINVKDLGGYEQVGVGDVIYVLHYDENNGGWEIIPATVKSVGGDMWIDVTFKSLSPIGIVKVVSNNKVIALDKAGNPITDGNGNIPVLNDPNKTNNSKTDNSMTSNAKNTTTTTTTLGKSPKTGEF